MSALTQAAITEALDRFGTAAWLDALPPVSGTVEHAEAMRALDEARAELDD